MKNFIIKLQNFFIIIFFVLRGERVNKPTYLHGIHSRSSSATSGSVCTSPTRSPRQQSPSPGARDNLSNWSSSVPALNSDRHCENGHSERTSRRQLDMNKADKICEKENRFEKKSDKSSKIDRKLNSKELIEKQKNWTSHFSKTRPNRCNSDPNKAVQNQSANKASEQLFDNQLGVSPLQDGKRPNDITNSPSSRSSSFRSDISSNDSLPPPLPARNASPGIVNKNRSAINSSPISNVPENALHTGYNKYTCTSPIEPEYAEINKLKKDKNFENLTQNQFETDENNDIPEYAVVQKHVSRKNSDVSKNSVSPVKDEKNVEEKESVNEISPRISNKNFSQYMSDRNCHSSFHHTTNQNNDVTNFSTNKVFENQKVLSNTESKRFYHESKESTESSKLDNQFSTKRDFNNVGVNNHCKNEDTNHNKSSKESSPDWDNNYEYRKKESPDVQRVEKTPEFEGGSPIKGSDSISSSMSPPSSPSADSKEEKAEKEASEKIQLGMYTF